MITNNNIKSIQLAYTAQLVNNKMNFQWVNTLQKTEMKKKKGWSV